MKTVERNPITIVEELKNIWYLNQRLISDPSFYAILSSDGTTLPDYMKNLERKERTLKIEYALKMHVTDKGQSRVVNQDGRGLYYTKCAGKKKYSAKTKDDLYLKLYDEVYGINHTLKNTTFESVFDEMMAEKDEAVDTNKNASNQNNIIRVRQDYKRFILPDLAKMNVQQIDEDFLLDYSKKMLLHLNKKDGKPPTQKSYDENYCGILRKVFKYAKHQKYISNNIMADFDEIKSNNPDIKLLLDCSKKTVKEKVLQPKEIDLMVAEFDKRIIDFKHRGEIYNFGFMGKTSVGSGVRASELVSLQWIDIDFVKKRIHVHSQQLFNRTTKEYTYCPLTKEERMKKHPSKDGRYVPLLPNVEKTLMELKSLQEKFGIHSKWVFCHPDGTWIHSYTEYQQPLKRMCRSLGIEITNNHAIRMYFNSYVLIPAGISLANRARILGHTPEVNLTNYTFESADYCDNSLVLLCNRFFNTDASDPR